VTETDARRIRGLLAARAASDRDQAHLDGLRVELERALVLDPAAVPRDVITMNSRVLVHDLTSGARREMVLVLPGEADVAAQRISVLAPLGTALLGYREGDEVEWLMPGGLRRLRVERVTQQEERAAGSDGRIFAARMMTAASH
jgi:regulator of nucleoside diphosphate kinase